MAESFTISIPENQPPPPPPPTTSQPPPPQTSTTPPTNPTTFVPPLPQSTSAPPPNPTTFVVDKTLSSTANLVKLLPSGTVLAFQSLSPIFSNHGKCLLPDKIATGFLILLSAFTCFLLSFSDSFVASNGKHYYGIATLKGLYIINNENDEDDVTNIAIQNHDELRRRRIRVLDLVHAFFSCFFFLALAFSDSDVQNCLFPTKYADSLKELFMNFPIGVGLFCGLVFMIFPTSRKGIGSVEHHNA